MNDFEVAVSKGNWSSILHEQPLFGDRKIFPTAPEGGIVHLIIARSRDSLKSASLKCERDRDELDEDEDIDDSMRKLRKMRNYAMKKVLTTVPPWSPVTGDHSF